MSLFWNFLFLSGALMVKGLFLNIDCSREQSNDWLKSYCERHPSHSGSSEQHSGSSGQHSGSSEQHSTQNTDDFGCNNVYEKNRMNLLWQDWKKNGDVDVVERLYADILVSLKADNAGSLPDRRYKRKTVHDEAYTSHDTVPDYNHVRYYVFYRMNDKCRIEIMHEINKVLPHTTTTTQATTHHTRKPHHHHHNTHAQTKAHTAAPATTKPTTIHVTTKATTHPATTKPTTVLKTKAVPTTVPATSAPATTVDNNPTANIPKMLNVSYRCNLLKFVTALAHNDLLIDPNAGMCTDGTHTQSEALVTALCNVPATEKWRKGVNVVTNCKNIPPYTPIAMFVFDSYVTSGNELAGVLVECTADGFKAAFQLCGHSPRIYNLKQGSPDTKQNAYNYFVVA